MDLIQFNLNHWAVTNAIEYMRERDALYRKWNERHDAITPEQRPTDQELHSISLEIARKESQACYYLHDVLFALGIYEHPMAR